MERLNALVTGAGQGIGEACARALAASGHRVWVNDINGPAAERVAASIGGVAITGDVAEPSKWVGPLLDAVPLHVLVHNAGFDADTPVSVPSVDTFDRLQCVMMRGPYELTSLLLPSLTAANGSAVFFISSVQGFQTYPNMAGYAGAKAGQIGMVKSMALELGQFRVRVLAVSPGYIHTAPMEAWAGATPDPADTLAAAAAMHPLGRMGNPADIGAFIAFLAGRDAEFINGVNLVIDGGLSAKYP